MTSIAIPLNTQTFHHRRIINRRRFVNFQLLLVSSGVGSFSFLLSCLQILLSCLILDYLRPAFNFGSKFGQLVMTEATIRTISAYKISFSPEFLEMTFVSDLIDCISKQIFSYMLLVSLLPTIKIYNITPERCFEQL